LKIPKRIIQIDFAIIHIKYIDIQIEQADSNLRIKVK